MDEKASGFRPLAFFLAYLRNQTVSIGHENNWDHFFNGYLVVQKIRR